MHILGISAFFHDSAACIVRDGEIVAAAQEERFTRIKNDAGMPLNAVSYCLREAKICSADVDYVVFYESPHLKFSRILSTSLAAAPSGFSDFFSWLNTWSKFKLWLDAEIPALLGGLEPVVHFDDRTDLNARLVFCRHHEAHAASAFFPSPFDEAAILTVDAVGEWSTSSLGVGTGNEIRLLQETRFPDSLGMLYSAFTYYCGFKVNSGEYKLMGLAPYGSPKYVSLIKDNIVTVCDDGSIHLCLDYFGFHRGGGIIDEKLERLFNLPRRTEKQDLTQQHMDIAASIQCICEESMLKTVRHARELTGKSNLVMAGGVALNCVANGRLLREGPFEKIWIQPAAGDAGGALGSALWLWHGALKKPRVANKSDSQKGSLLGPRFSMCEVSTLLDALGAEYRVIENEDELLTLVARLIIEGRVVGWFQGRMEYGPRALGCRSILGDPRRPEMQTKMNVKIKFRESFRPFAPSVMRDRAKDYFDIPEGFEDPYMLTVFGVAKEQRIALTDEARAQLSSEDLRVRLTVARSTIQTVTHVDYSARLQTVDEARHGRYYRLLRRFHDLSGCPVLVNTSFNVRGEPIVHTPEDAFACFMSTDMEALVLEDAILLKEDQSSTLAKDLYRQEFAGD